MQFDTLAEVWDMKKGRRNGSQGTRKSSGPGELLEMMIEYTSFDREAITLWINAFQQ